MAALIPAIYGDNCSRRSAGVAFQASSAARPIQAFGRIGRLGALPVRRSRRADPLPHGGSIASARADPEPGRNPARRARHSPIGRSSGGCHSGLGRSRPALRARPPWSCLGACGSAASAGHSRASCRRAPSAASRPDATRARARQSTPEHCVVLRSNHDLSLRRHRLFAENSQGGRHGFASERQASADYGGFRRDWTVLCAIARGGRGECLDLLAATRGAGAGGCEDRRSRERSCALDGGRSG